MGTYLVSHIGVHRNDSDCSAPVDVLRGDEIDYRSFLTSLCFQNIFIGEDIRKQLPVESATFDDVNSKWKVGLLRERRGSSLSPRRRPS